MNRLKLLSVTFLALLVASPRISQAQTTVNSDAVGFVTLNVPPANGTTRRTSYLSLPLIQRVDASFSGQSVGTITGVSSNSLSNSNANWTPGALSQPATPYAIHITSGNGAGRIFLIASSANTGGASLGTPNTASTVFLSPLETAAGNTPTAAGSAVQAGDTYRIIEVDTLASAFGTPATTSIRGGTNAASADTVNLVVNGSSKSYYYHTTLNRWALNPLNSHSDNTALHPYFGVIYSRLGTNPLSFRISGTVPDTARKTQIKNSGLTTLAQFWPSDSTLVGLGIHSLPNWLRGSSTANADTVILVATNGTATAYWHNGTNWRSAVVGSRDTTPVPAGSAIYINKRGSATGSTTLSQGIPYSL